MSRSIQHLERAERAYADALRRGFWRQVRRWLGRGCNDLLLFEDIFPYLKDLPARDLGQQRVPLDSLSNGSGRQSVRATD